MCFEVAMSNCRDNNGWYRDSRPCSEKSGQGLFVSTNNLGRHQFMKQSLTHYRHAGGVALMCRFTNN